MEFVATSKPLGLFVNVDSINENDNLARPWYGSVSFIDEEK